MRLRHRGEAGFTLVELVVTVAIVGVVMGALSSAIIVGLRTTDDTTEKLADSHDLQLLSVYLPADVQSSIDGRIDTTSTSPEQTLCASEPTGTNFIRFQWTEPGGTQTFKVAYQLESAGSGTVLARHSCVDTGTVTRVVVAHGLGAPTPTLQTATLNGRTVTLVLTLDSGLTTRITATRRTPGAVPPEVVMTFPVNSGEYNDASWNAGCSPSGVCGTASDTVGLDKVEVAVLRVADSTYWDGTAFAGTSAVYNLATGTSTWTHGFPASSFPTEGSYIITVRVTNTSGSQITEAASLVIDRSAPVTADNTAAIGSAWKNSNQTVTLSPIDNGGAGVAATYYTSNGTNPTTASSNGTSIALATEGSFTVKYFSVDGASNQEAVKTAATQVRIDKTAPTAAGIDSLPTHIKNGYTFTGTGTDALSGIASYEFFYCSGVACTPTTSIGSVAVAPGTLAWNGQPADGAYRVKVRATDAAGNTLDSAVQAVTVDNTAPGVTAAAIQLVNGGGNNNAGKAEQGDSVVVGFSEALKASSLCSTWSSDTATQTLNDDNQVTVTITENGANDTLSLAVSGACGNAFRFGSVALAGDYVSATTTFLGSGNPTATRSAIQWNPTATTLTVTLGKVSTSNNVQSGVAAATVTYTPVSGLTDIAGNALPTTAVNSSGVQRL